MPFPIKLSRPVIPQRIPAFDTVLGNARTIMADTANWVEGKTFNHGLVRTFSKKIPTGPPWHMRVSHHPPSVGTFGDFWDALGVKHSTNESEYIPEITKSTMIQAVEPGVMEIWTIHYGLSAPFSPRTFTVLIVTHLENVTPRQGWIISIPFDAHGDEAMMAMEEKGVRGKYAAVERLKEMEDGSVEWSVATTTTVGGFVPDWFTSRSVPGAIAEDVQQFLAWFQEFRDKKKQAQPTATSSRTKT